MGPARDQVLRSRAGGPRTSQRTRRRQDSRSAAAQMRSGAEGTGARGGRGQPFGGCEGSEAEGTEADLRHDQPAGG